MEFFLRAPGSAQRVGVFPGTFNPVTVAHMGLARAALTQVQEVLFVLPRELPHKRYEGASFSERISMLNATLAGCREFSLAASEGGLFSEIGAECRQAYGAGVEFAFLCGRDAAERVAGWDYGNPKAFAEMLNSFQLLVAARGGSYHPEQQFQAAVQSVELEPEFEAISASEIRRRIACGEPWEHMTPPAVRDLAREIYARRD